MQIATVSVTTPSSDSSIGRDPETFFYLNSLLALNSASAITTYRVTPAIEAVARQSEAKKSVEELT